MNARSRSPGGEAQQALADGLMPARTFYWHDYETFGADPRRDRPAQFAGIRTDENLERIAEPQVLFCRPADDMLPDPAACLLTGITPQQAARQGVREVDFIGRILGELSRPGTCGVGYNSIRFDDEVTRHTLYRNLFDPYAREWRNGNSRWDIIDMVRLARALRPDGIEWPDDEDGNPCFRLDALTLANGIEHAHAHDALGDVRASIALARLIRDRQPQLYDYVFEHRTKEKARDLLRVDGMKPVLHVSGKYAARGGCLAVVVPLVCHPLNKNGIIVYDLAADPGPLIELPADEVRARVFTPPGALPEDTPRIPLKTVHLNRCPVLVPVNAMKPAQAEQWGIDGRAWRCNLNRIRAAGDLPTKVEAVFAGRQPSSVTDPDWMLYSGGFFSEADKAKLVWIRSLSPGELKTAQPSFQDPRLGEMLFRFRARNYPETLDAAEEERWEKFRRARLTQTDSGASIVLEEYRERIRRMEQKLSLAAPERAILNDLLAYGNRIGDSAGMSRAC